MGFIKAIDEWVSVNGGANENDVKRLREFSAVLDEKFVSMNFNEVKVIQSSGRTNTRYIQFEHKGSKFTISPSLWYGLIIRIEKGTTTSEITGKNLNTVADALAREFTVVYN